MDIRTDIERIKQELDNVTDPHLILKVKDLLGLNRSEIDLLEEKMILEALEDVKNGRVHTSEEMGKEIERWIRER